MERVLGAELGFLIIPAPVTAEVDYFLRSKRLRLQANSVIGDLASGKLQVFCLSPEDYAIAREYDRRYADFDIGLADLSVIIAAHRYRTNRILTFDERHFRALRPLDGGSFVLLPADE